MEASVRIPELTREQADKMVLGEDPQFSPKMANDEANRWGKILDGVKVETKDGIIPCSYSPYLVENDPKSFAALIAAAYAKVEKGEALTSKELYALMRSKGNLPDAIKYNGVPPRARKALDQAARLGIEEGIVTQRELSEKIKIGLPTINRYLKKYPEYYKAALDRAYESVLSNDKLGHQAAKLRLMRSMMSVAAKAPKVVEDVMLDTNEPGATRIKAAFGSMGTFGVGPEQKTVIERVTNISAETIQIAKEHLDSDGFIATEAEVIDE